MVPGNLWWGGGEKKKGKGGEQGSASSQKFYRLSSVLSGEGKEFVLLPTGVREGGEPSYNSRPGRIGGERGAGLVRYDPTENPGKKRRKRKENLEQKGKSRLPTDRCANGGGGRRGTEADSTRGGGERKTEKKKLSLTHVVSNVMGEGGKGKEEGGGRIDPRSCYQANKGSPCAFFGDEEEKRKEKDPACPSPD